MNSYIYVAIVTLLACLLCFWMSTQVSLARRKAGISAPATTGDPLLERTIRAHYNTLEWMPIFLPSLWLCALYLSDAAAAGLGAVWLVGRGLYYVGYARAVEKRLPGFAIQAGACVLLIVGAVVGLVTRFTASP